MTLVALVNPPLQRNGFVSPHLGLAVIADALVMRGHDVMWLDLDLEKQLRGLSSFDACADLMKRRLEDREPAVVGFTSMFNNSLLAEKLIADCRKCLPGAAIVAGGPHFGAQAHQALARMPELDFVLVGEAEKAFADLVDALQSGTGLDTIGNLAQRGPASSEVPREDPLLDLAAPPPRNMWANLADRLPFTQYLETAVSGPRAIYIEAGRGCPFSCNFCATAPFWKNRFRVKRPETIVSEMEWLHAQHGYAHFILVHDLLTVRRDYMSDLCDAIFDARLPVTWMANSRIDLNHEGILPKLHTSGCSKLFFGIESGSREVQAFTTKRLDPETVGPAIGRLTEHGVNSTCSYVIGFPDETPQELSRTVHLAAQTKLQGAETVQFHRLRLWPPAPIMHRAAEARFDEASLRIEWPFADVRPVDLKEISENPGFFSGYFSLDSACGSHKQLAQAEQFFVTAIATVPISVALLCTILGETLITRFNDLIGKGLAVGEITADKPQLSDHWEAIRPLFEGLARAAAQASPEKRLLCEELLRYELARLAFVEGDNRSGSPRLPDSREEEFQLGGVDLQDLCDRLKNGDDLTDHSPGHAMDIRFERLPSGKIDVFVRDLARPAA